MTNIHSKRITLESVNEITDWVSPLEKVYQRQMSQLDRQHQYLRQRDEQAEKADPGVVALKTFKNILEFGGAAAKLYQAHKGAQAKGDAEFKTKLAQTPAMLQTAEAVNSSIKNYNENQFVARQQDALSYAVKGLNNSDAAGAQEAALQIQKFTPRQRILYKEFLAGKTLQTLSYDKFVTDIAQNNSKLQEQVASGSPDFIQGTYLQWQRDQLAHLDLNEEAFIALTTSELRRQQSTAESINKVSSLQRVATAKDVQFDEYVDAQKFDGVGLNRYLSTYKEQLIKEGKEVVSQEEHPEGLTEGQQADEIIYNRLNRLALDGRIPSETLTSAKDSLKFFSKDKINQLVRSADLGKTRIIGLETADDQNEYKRIKASLLQGNDESAAIQRLRNRRNLPEKQISELEETNIADQSEEKYRATIAQYRDAISRGNLDTEELKLIKNDKAREELLTIDKRIKLADKNYNYDQYDKAFGDKINLAQNNRTLAEGALSPQGQEIVDDLNRMRRKLWVKEVLAQYDRNGNFTENLNITSVVNSGVEDYYVRNGGGTRDGDGKFSVHGVPGKDGVFKNWRPYTDALEASDDEHNVFYNDDFKTRYERSLTDVNGKRISKAERHKMREGIFTDEMIVGTLQNGYFSEEMQYIATREGESLTELFKKAVKVLPPEFAELHNIEVGKNEGPDQQLTNSLDKLLKELETDVGTEQYNVASQLRSTLKWYGLESFTPNQLNRLYKLLEATSSDDTGIVEQAEQHDQSYRAKALEEKNKRQAARFNQRTEERDTNLNEVDEGEFSLNYPTGNPYAGEQYKFPLNETDGK
tara:strand:- start:146 stop:2587 length:2442 start_codon:yes stop_codon:yes gene_type:complete